MRARPAARRRSCGRAGRPIGSNATSHRLERRVRGRSESLARQFDRVLRVLESWGYVDGWALTDAGELLAAALHRVATSCSPRRCARACSTGSTPAELAAVVSCFTYERRGPEGTSRCRRRGGRADGGEARPRDRAASRRDLNANEDDAGLPETRAPDPGLHARRLRLGGGRRPRRRARRRRDDRRRLRAPREAVHRPAPPGRRRRARTRDRGHAPARPPTRAYRGVVAASSVAGSDRRGP